MALTQICHPRTPCWTSNMFSFSFLVPEELQMFRQIFMLGEKIMGVERKTKTAYFLCWFKEKRPGALSAASKAKVFFFHVRKIQYPVKSLSRSYHHQLCISPLDYSVGISKSLQFKHNFSTSINSLKIMLHTLINIC